MTNVAETPVVETVEETAIDTAQITVWRHRPTVAYVEMVVAKKKAKGDLTDKELKEFRLGMLAKHGLPATKAEQTKLATQIAAAKKQLKDDAKAARRAVRLEARRLAKLAADEAPAEEPVEGETVEGEADEAVDPIEA